MRALVILALVLILQGCAEFQAIKSVGKDLTAQAADEQMQAAVWSLCNAASLGSLRRMFNSPPEREELFAWCDRVQSASK